MNLTANRIAFLSLWWVNRKVNNAVKLQNGLFLLETDTSKLIIKYGDLKVFYTVNIIFLAVLFFLYVSFGYLKPYYLVTALVVTLSLIPLTSPYPIFRVERPSFQTAYGFLLLVLWLILSYLFSPSTFFVGGFLSISFLTLTNLLTVSFLTSYANKRPFEIVKILPVDTPIEEKEIDKEKLKGFYLFLWD